MTPLEMLIENIHRVVKRRTSPPELVTDVEQVLRPTLCQPGLLDEQHRTSSIDGYRQHVIYVPPDRSFSLLSLVWAHGQETPIHDHRAWCVVGVYEGEESEIRYEVIANGG